MIFFKFISERRLSLWEFLYYTVAGSFINTPLWVYAILVIVIGIITEEFFEHWGRKA
jgi:hypothetical protein